MGRGQGWPDERFLQLGRVRGVAVDGLGVKRLFMLQKLERYSRLPVGTHRHLAVEAGAVADVAARATGYLDAKPDAVLVVVDPHLDDFLHQAAGGPLVPEHLPAAAEVVGLARLNRPGERFAVHHRHHQHLARVVVGGDAGNESLGIEFGGENVPLLDLFDCLPAPEERIGIVCRWQTHCLSPFQRGILRGYYTTEPASVPVFGHLTLPLSRAAMRPTILRHLLVSLSLVAGGCTRPVPPLVELPPPEVRVARPVHREVTEYVVFTGNAAAVAEVAIRARVSGFVTQVHFLDGQRVHQGERLFTIDERPYSIARDQAAAEVDKQAAELAELEREVVRNAPLVPKAVVTREQFEILVAKRDMSKAMLEKARAALADAQLDLEFCTLTSPLDGRISAKNVNEGDLVTADATASRPLTTVVSIAPVHVYFEADERSVLLSRARALADRAARSADPGTPLAEWRNIKDLAIPVEVALVAETDFPRRGILDFVDVAADASTGTIRCRAELPNADELVLPGMFVRVRLPFGDPQPAVLVPERAIGIDQGRRYVCVVGLEDRVERRTVVPGILDGGLRVIVEGLSGDERLVVEGLQKAREGAVVRPVDMLLEPSP